MNRFRDSVVVITGASSGIGRSLALEFSRFGANLALCDINDDGLQETRDLLEENSSQGKVSLHKVDVSDRDEYLTFVEEVKQIHGRVNVIVNNAGVSLVDRAEAIQKESFEWLMGINFWGVVYGSQLFLPLLKGQSVAHIVNISSIFGIVSFPLQSAYNASKFAVKGFTESLAIELKDSGVQVHCVHPGAIKTNIVRSARVVELSGYAKDQNEMVSNFDRMAKVTPLQAAQTIIEGMLKGKSRILIGRDAKMLDVYQRLFPSKYKTLVPKLVNLGRKALASKNREVLNT